ncbi:MAG TPA: cysteine--tRNA ligase [Chloroflexota bacterium]|nr:cysteine--tRNA ligase [Chloroflexota bacterium]
MPPNLSDTLSAALKAVPPGPIKLYVCGVTPYDTTHLGHAFTFVQFDTLVRALRWLDPDREVTYVQNVTDIDDSILARARKLGVDWRALGDEQTAQYRVDMRALNVADPTHFVRATDALGTIHDLIARLIGAGAAYVVEGGTVFFRMQSAPTYGELSKLPRSKMLEIASQQDDADVDDPRKEDPLDWALWKGWSGKSDEPCWGSPWGGGRPGWHIECSALCYQYLGPQVTIHGGGADLVFPHHESEIAQSEKATGARPFVQIWSHVAMVRMDGEKMSKSLGNMVFVRDLLKRYSADAIRLCLLGHHYRTVWEWSPAEMDNAAALAERLALAAEQPDSAETGQKEAFAAALADDLNTPQTIEVLGTVSGEPLRHLASVLGLTLHT